jgi:LysM repeat protein
VKGDTLSKIAHKFKTTAAAIMTENNITDPTKLSIGKKLRIPSRESRSAGNAVPVAAPLPPQAQPQPQAPAEAMSDDTSAQLANFRSSSPDSNF